MTLEHDLKRALRRQSPDAGFAGRCPNCDGWIHFTIHGKKAISAEEAEALPKLPDDWYANALIL